MTVADSISLAVCTRDRPASVERYLAPLLRKAVSAGIPAVIVDQSRDQRTEALIRGLPGVRYLRSGPGVSRGRNVAIRATATPLIALTDDDMTAPDDWFERLVEIFDRTADVGAVCGRVLDERGRPLSSASAGIHRWPAPPFGLGFGANIGIRREALDAVGFFDETLGPGTRFYAAEDTDLIYRILRAGWSIACSHEGALVHHDPRPASAHMRLHYRYGVGAGAQTAKHVIAGDRVAARIGIREAAQHVYWLGRGLATLELRAAALQLPFLAGLATGFGRRALRGGAELAG